jgi:hypothetical protein
MASVVVTVPSLLPLTTLRIGVLSEVGGSRSYWTVACTPANHERSGRGQPRFQPEKRSIMNNDAFATQIRDLILQLLQEGSRYKIDEWKTSMNPIEFGVLSWTLGAFYWGDGL